MSPATSPTPTTRMPVAFLPHGGGPWPFVDLGLGDEARGFDSLAAYLRGVKALPPATPRALLVVSSHREDEVPTVTTAGQPGLLYDYYAFRPSRTRSPGLPRASRRSRRGSARS
jgi:aromatic ring-opening dioxygenase catalytic subunit (LigB family)